MGRSVNNRMDKETRNKIIESRCADFGISPRYDSQGRALYVPDFEDKILYYENCENPELKMAIGNALTEMMGDPEGDDSWTDIF